MQITRRQVLRLCGAAPFSRARAAGRPNVVLILADDMGYGDLSSYGCPDIRTPNIDSIGAKGVRLTKYYTNAPDCSPTRTATLTGRYQARVGGLECAIGVGNVGRYDDAEWLAKQGELGLPVSETSMARIFKNAGYDTACFGKWHLGYADKFSPNRHGFDEYFGILGGNADYFTHREEDGTNVLYRNGKPVEAKGYTTDLIAEEAVSWLARKRSKPFFLYVPFTSPHTPIQDPDGYDPKTGAAPVRQGHRPTYAKMIERLDRRVGDILSQLDRMGAAGETLVIFSSDNGGDPNGRNDPWRGKKGSLWEGGIRVPCMMRWPGRIPGGKTIDQVAVSMDLLPTMLAATGIAAPSGRPLDGVNLLPVLEGLKPNYPRTLFWRAKRGTRVRKAVRVGDLKLVIDEGEELHDLAKDELEQRNLLPTAEMIAKGLRAKLAAWEQEVMAPRLRPFRSAPG
ncbi:MAG TPA: sulfatase-like hydrolase/transferase [Bryobacteraceae bacterium]|nr:sulfatase-like hydrolase/transferase [Bryobacteraceae bacterium]